MTKLMIETESFESYILGEGLHIAPDEEKQGHLRSQNFPAVPIHLSM